MSQAWASLSRTCFLLTICCILSACNGSYSVFEDDEDFDAEAKNVDIEEENSEELTLNVLQSAYTAHFRSALYTFLDASELPNDAQPLDGANSFTRTCGIGGSATYTFTRAAGEVHKAGDRISLSFDNCDEAGMVYNGSLEARYTKIKGLNDTFTGTDTPTCLANILDELDLDSNQVINVSGDDLKFRIVADTVEVDVLDYEFTEQNGLVARRDIVLDTYVIHKDDETVLVNNLLDPPLNAITSVNGDQIYSVSELASTKYNCQNYERTLSATLDDFSTTKDDLTTILNGTVTLFEAQDKLTKLNQEIVDSNFQTRVVQGNVERIFNMSNYRVQKALTLENNSYSYLFEGLVSSNALKGTVELTNAGRLAGNITDAFPTSGSLEIKGRGLERILLRVNFQDLEFQIDLNGDSTGNGFSDFDARIDTRWSKLYNREFQF